MTAVTKTTESKMQVRRTTILTCWIIPILQSFSFKFPVELKKKILQILLFNFPCKQEKMLQILLKERFILEKLYRITHLISVKPSIHIIDVRILTFEFKIYLRIPCGTTPPAFNQIIYVTWFLMFPLLAANHIACGSP